MKRHDYIFASIIIVALGIAVGAATMTEWNPDMSKIDWTSMDGSGEIKQSTVQPAVASLKLGGNEPKETDFCDAWQKSSEDSNVSSELVKCDSDTRTLVFNNSIRQNKTLPANSAFKVSTVDDKLIISAGTCTAASKADCKSGAAKDFASAKLAYDKDSKEYVIEKAVKAAYLPNITVIQFGKDDKLEGVEIKFGAHTETWSYEIVGNEAAGYYIWETEPTLSHPADITAENNFGGTGSGDAPPNYRQAGLYFNTSHPTTDNLTVETTFIGNPLDYATQVLMAVETIISPHQAFDYAQDDGIWMSTYDNSEAILYLQTMNDGVSTQKTVNVGMTASHIYKFRRNQTAIAFYVDNVVVGEITTNLPDEAMYVGMAQGNARTAVNARAYWTNMSVDVDLVPPTYFLLFGNATVSYPGNYSATQGIEAWAMTNTSGGYGSVIFELGSTNYTAANQSFAGNLTWTNWSVNAPPQAAGTYGFRIYAYDSDGNSNTSTEPSFIINKTDVASGISLLSSNGWTISAGSSTSISCAASAGVTALYQNTTAISNPYATAFVNGTYDFNCTVADAANISYSPHWTSNTLTASYYIVGECSGIVTTPAYTFYNFAERNLSTTNNTISGITFIASLIGSSLTSITTANFTTAADHFDICIYPAWANYTVDAWIDYGTDAQYYPQRSYFLSNATINNVTGYANLYGLEGTYATITSITVKDTTGGYLSDAIVKAERYYPSENAYHAVAMGKTGTTGIAVMRLQTNDAWYKFVVEKNGVVLKTFDRMIIGSTALQLTIAPSGISEYWAIRDKVSASCNYIAPSTLQCTGSDTTGTVQTWHLKVDSQGTVAWNSICDTTVAGSSATINCNLGTVTNKLYYYSMTYAASPPVLLLANYMNFATAVSAFAALGLFATFIFVGTLGFAGIWNPAVSLTMAGVGLLICMMIGFVPPAAQTAIVGAIIVLAVVIIKLKT